MGQSIIRISSVLHADFKQMVAKYPQFTISSAAELLISNALRRGELAETKENAYKAVRELEQIFKSWTKQQEKTHLSRIGEDVLALAHQLKDTATVKDVEEALSLSFQASLETHKQFLEKLLEGQKKWIYDSIATQFEALKMDLPQKKTGLFG